MSRGKYPFRQSDIKRAFEAAREVGLEPHTVEVQAPNGTIIRVIGSKAAPLSNDLDDELKEFEKRHGNQVSS